MNGPYAALGMGGAPGDGQASVTYNVATGEVAVDAPVGGGDLGQVDLIYVPEPSSLILLCLAVVFLATNRGSSH